MAGTREGAMKARERNLAKDPEFYSKIGKQSWKNPKRSRETGFAKLPKEKHIELSSKGGKKTKSDYKTTQRTEEIEYETAETIHEIFSQDQDSDSTGVSE